MPPQSQPEALSVPNFRREYTLAGLRRAHLDPDPLVQFRIWFDQLLAAKPSADLLEINAMTLATADRDGHPSTRVVLLKAVDQRGFIFFTNYDSRKGRELAENPHAALTFYWPELERQVCIAGRAAKVPRAESEAYFNSRPRGSRLAAWASHQSGILPDRSALDQKWAELEAQFPGSEIPTPPYWGGYVLAPTRIEFWQGRPNRMHDRFCYSQRPGNIWLIERLAP